MSQPLSYIKKHRDQFLAQWFEALRIASVSGDPKYQSEIKAMVDWLASFFQNELKFKTQVIATKGNPLVYAESPKVPGAPTLLIYGHYDVQPPEPLDKWESPPFEPTIRNGNVYCRGANDDKGQLFTHLFAVKAILETQGTLPLQVKFICEGEEESGSGGITGFLKKPESKALLAADLIVVSDGQMFDYETPAITYGLRGVVGFELTLNGPKRDLHSGHYGGSIFNPAIALAKLLASVTDETGIIQVPGFYDGIIPLSESERKSFAELPFDEQGMLDEVGMTASFGEPGYSTLERRSARPSFDINGLTSGYQGKGGKTIIPSQASAKFTFRMVPKQDPAKLHRNLKQFFKKQLPPGITMKLDYEQGTSGMVVPLDSPYIAPAKKVLRKTFGRTPYFIREGGSIPIVAALRETLEADLLLIGFGLPDDAIHSPNEKFAVKSFEKGMETSVRLILELVPK